MNLKFIYKIINKHEWLKFKKIGLFFGSKKDLEDGYIHFSEQDQINMTLNKFFNNQKNLVLLKIDTTNLDDLFWEQSSDGNMFPHLYSSLDIKHLVSEEKIAVNKDGSFNINLFD